MGSEQHTSTDRRENNGEYPYTFELHHHETGDDVLPIPTVEGLRSLLEGIAEEHDVRGDEDMAEAFRAAAKTVEAFMICRENARIEESGLEE